MAKSNKKTEKTPAVAEELNTTGTPTPAPASDAGHEEEDTLHDMEAQDAPAPTDKPEQSEKEPWNVTHVPTVPHETSQDEVAPEEATTETGNEEIHTPQPTPPVEKDESPEWLSQKVKVKKHFPQLTDEQLLTPGTAQEAVGMTADQLKSITDTVE